MSSFDDDVAALLALPVPDVWASRAAGPLTSELVTGPGGEAMATVAATDVVEASGKAAELLRRNGMDPDSFTVKRSKISEWTLPSGELGVSCRFEYEPVAGMVGESRRVVQELVDLIAASPAAPLASSGDGGGCWVVATGDQQFGKGDGDGPDGALVRTLASLRDAAALVSRDGRAKTVLLSWLGDHVEGFNSQGGANAWRTPLTLTEQMRLVRHVMTYALTLFAPLADELIMVAVPGNHGETTRFAGKGVTRFDDSFDTDALIAVSEAARLAGERFDHVRFYTPQADEMTVTVQVGDLVVGHAHGHQWKPGGHMAWWKGQAFGGSPLRDAGVLIAGHLHHLAVEENGGRTFVQVPSMEDESTWWRHRTGTVGNPGLVVLAVSGDGISAVFPIHPEARNVG